MSHFAKIENNIVTQVIVAEQNVINSGLFGNPASWVQTSYNTRGGEHPEGKPLRKNFAGIGYTYDSVRDAFIPPKPYPSWILDEQRCRWDAPVTRPDNGTDWIWDEPTLSWVKIGNQTIVVNTNVITITEPVIEVIAPTPTPTASDTIVISTPTAFDTITLTTASETITL